MASKNSFVYGGLTNIIYREAKAQNAGFKGINRVSKTFKSKPMFDTKPKPGKSVSIPKVKFLTGDQVRRQQVLNSAGIKKIF